MPRRNKGLSKPYFSYSSFRTDDPLNLALAEFFVNSQVTGSAGTPHEDELLQLDQDHFVVGEVLGE